MTINAKYQNAFVLDYKDSPKVAFTSNHGIKISTLRLGEGLGSPRSAHITIQKDFQ